MRRHPTAAVVAGAMLLVIFVAGCGAEPTSRAEQPPPATAPTARTTSATTVTTTAPPDVAARTTGPPAPTTTAPVPAPAPTPTTVPAINTFPANIGVLAPVAAATPVRVEAPDLGIDGVVAPTGVNDLGELDVPPDARTLVWWQHGPTPGSPGSAVIAGHLNWRGVEGTFSHLDQLPVGATLTVTYNDLSQRSFVVRSVDLVAKPAVAVDGTFSKDGESLLRLITCGGEFDSSTRHYRSNVIVTAIPAAV